MSNSVNYAQPDITLGLDFSGVIRRAVLSNAIADQGGSALVGQRWADTVTDGGSALQQMLESAQSVGVSAFRQVRQRFPSGLEIPVEYTTVRLGGTEGLIAVGRSLEAVAELRSRLSAAKAAMERSAWKLRGVETRYQLFFDTSSQPLLLVAASDLRVIEANAAATRALGIASHGDRVDEIMPEQRGALKVMLDRLREDGRVPGIVVHLGAERRRWLVRASLVTTERAPAFLLQLSPAWSSPTVVGRVDRDAKWPTFEEPDVAAPLESATLDRSAMRRVIQNAIASTERDCIVAALAHAKGNRSHVAKLLGISLETLEAKLEGDGLDDEKPTDLH